MIKVFISEVILLLNNLLVFSIIISFLSKSYNSTLLSNLENDNKYSFISLLFCLDNIIKFDSPSIFC